MSTAFIISKIGWEYNDETYYRPESEGGTPIKAYRTKQKAQAECDKLNAPLRDPKTAYMYAGYVTEACDGEENLDEYGCVPITTDYEVIAVELEE